MTNIIVLIGAGSIGQAIARRVSAGKHILLADIGVPLSLEPKRTLSRSLHGMDQDSPSVRDTLCKFPNRRVANPNL